MNPLVVVGIGELGGELSRGLLRTGHPVFPVTRRLDAAAVEKECPDPALVLVTVAETDLDPVLSTLPDRWKTRVGLVQNELLPRDWERHGLKSPTVAVIWFEKKPPIVPKSLLPSQLYGPAAGLLQGALAAIGLPSRILESEEDLLFEMVRKNLYILTVNLAGLDTGGTVERLYRDHHHLTVSVAAEVLDLQEALVGRSLPRDTLLNGFVEAIEADPAHRCTGRSAPGRLARALRHATRLGVPVPALRALALRHGVSE